MKYEAYFYTPTASARDNLGYDEVVVVTTSYLAKEAPVRAKLQRLLAE